MNYVLYIIIKFDKKLVNLIIQLFYFLYLLEEMFRKLVMIWRYYLFIFDDFYFYVIEKVLCNNGYVGKIVLIFLIKLVYFVFFV